MLMQLLPVRSLATTACVITSLHNNRKVNSSLSFFFFSFQEIVGASFACKVAKFAYRCARNKVTCDPDVRKEARKVDRVQSVAGNC